MWNRALLAILILFTGFAQAAPGDLDMAFGPGGKVFTNIGRVEGSDTMYGSALQSDGKLVTVGVCKFDDANVPCVARLLPTGILDSAFGNAGLVRVDFGPGTHSFRAVAIDGTRIVVAGYCGPAANVDFCLARFVADGSPDLSFGTAGQLLVPIGTGHDLAYGLAIDANGNYVMAGNCKSGSTADFCLVRVDTNGALDTTFNGTGKLAAAIGTGIDGAYAVAIAGSKIIASGTCQNGTRYDFCVARFNADGSFDTSFNGRGIHLTSIGATEDFAVSVLVDGAKIYAGGECRDSASQSSFCLVRYNDDGSLDATFNGNGIVRTSIGSQMAIVLGLAIQSGKIVAAGYCKYDVMDACWARYNTDGSLETTVSGSGYPTLLNTTIYAVAFDGAKVVVAGFCGDSLGQFPTHSCVRRFEATGVADTSFGIQGLAILRLGVVSVADTANAVTRQTDGRLVVVGTCWDGVRNNACVARYLVDGTLDNSFNGQGYLTGVMGAMAATGRAVTMDGNKIVVAGLCGGNYCLARLNADGTFDPTLNGNGRVVTPLTGCNNGFTTAEVFSVHIDGTAIVVAGGCGVYFGSYYIRGTYVRYLADGSLDISFNGTGILITDVGPQAGYFSNAGLIPLAMVMDGDKILSAGAGTRFTFLFPSDFILARFRNDASPDSTLGGNGRVIIAMGTSSSAATAVATSGGKTVLAGTCSNGTDIDFCVVRLNADGTLDTSFNSTGKAVTAVGTGDDIVTGVAMHGDKIVVTGRCTSGTTTDFCIAVYNPDGSLDTTFAPLGTRILDMGTNNDRATGLEISGGFVTVAGTCARTTDDFCVARLELSGPTLTPTAPTPPSISSIVGGNTIATVNVAPPISNGGSAISGYTVTCLPGGATSTNATSPVVVTGLTNGTTYSCAAVANNSVGAGAASLPATVRPQSLYLIGVVSRKYHGNAGAFDLALDPAASFSTPMTIEPRTSGSSHTIVFQFTSMISFEGMVRVSDIADQVLGFAQLAPGGNEAVVYLTDIPDNQRLKVALTGVNGELDTSVTVGFAMGDVNSCSPFCSGLGRLNAADISAIKARSGRAVDAVNFRLDFNADGVLDSFDTSIAKAGSGRTLK